MDSKNLKLVDSIRNGIVFEVTDDKTIFVVKYTSYESELEVTKAVQKFYPNVVKYLGDFKCQSKLTTLNPWQYEAGMPVCDTGVDVHFMSLEILTSISNYLEELSLTRRRKIEISNYLEKLSLTRRRKIEISIIRQLVCILQLMQDELGFVHNDLHPENVMLRLTEAKNNTCKVVIPLLFRLDSIIIAQYRVDHF